MNALPRPRPRPRRTLPTKRRGSLIPAIAMALLVVGSAMALVLDRLWIDAAQLELRTAAEAGALAAAARLADDSLLSAADPSQRVAAARATAVAVAAENRVTGTAVVIRGDDPEDLLIGRLVRDARGRNVFLETNDSPTSVAVFASRTRSRLNPIALFFRQVSGQDYVDVGAHAEATIDNRVVGVAAFPGGAAPALPLAILASDPLGVRTDTWAAQIEAHGGADQYSFDPETGLVLQQPDGIPEMTLQCAPPGADARAEALANACLVDLGNDLTESRMARQIATGCTAEDLQPFGGAVRCDYGPLTVPSSGPVSGACRSALRQVVGESRACLLYATQQRTGARGVGRAACIRLVAVRIVSVAVGDQDSTEIVVQPCVLCTRTAVLSETAVAPATEGEPGNPYLYKLQLTN